MAKLTQEDKDRLRSISYNREGYKTSTKTTRKGRGTQTEHFSGRVDAHVRPKAVELKVEETEVGG